MGYDHVTVGWNQYDGYLQALQEAHIRAWETTPEESETTPEELEQAGRPLYERYREQLAQRLRLAHFKDWSGRLMVVEEVVLVDDQDCDGVSLIGIIVYPEGERPNVVTQVLIS